MRTRQLYACFLSRTLYLNRREERERDKLYGVLPEPLLISLVPTRSGGITTIPSSVAHRIRTPPVTTMRRRTGIASRALLVSVSWARLLPLAVFSIPPTQGHTLSRWATAITVTPSGLRGCTMLPAARHPPPLRALASGLTVALPTLAHSTVMATAMVPTPRPPQKARMPPSSLLHAYGSHDTGGGSTDARD